MHSVFSIGFLAQNKVLFRKETGSTWYMKLEMFSRNMGRRNTSCRMLDCCNNVSTYDTPLPMEHDACDG